jgi:hypothetical protein
MAASSPLARLGDFRQLSLKRRLVFKFAAVNGQHFTLPSAVHPFAKGWPHNEDFRLPLA